jgi:hypothetical protein
VNLNATVKSNADIFIIDPAYTFATPVFGGQLTLDMAAIAAVNSVGLSGTLTSTVGPLTVTRQGAISDSVAGFGDLYPKATMRWNAGVNNYMTYITGVPSGSMIRTVSPISASVTARLIGAEAIPISIRPKDMYSPP